MSNTSVGNNKNSLLLLLPTEVLADVFSRLIEVESNALLRVRRVCRYFDVVLRQHGKQIFLKAVTFSSSSFGTTKPCLQSKIEAYCRLMLATKNFGSFKTVNNFLVNNNCGIGNKLLKLLIAFYKKEKNLEHQKNCLYAIIEFCLSNELFSFSDLPFNNPKVQKEISFDYLKNEIFNVLEEKIQDNSLSCKGRKVAFLGLVKLLLHTNFNLISSSSYCHNRHLTELYIQKHDVSLSKGWLKFLFERNSDLNKEAKLFQNYLNTYFLNSLQQNFLYKNLHQEVNPSLQATMEAMRAYCLLITEIQKSAPFLKLSLIKHLNSINIALLKLFIKHYKNETILRRQENLFSKILELVLCLSALDYAKGYLYYSSTEKNTFGACLMKIFNVLKEKIQNNQLLEKERKLAFLNLMRLMLICPLDDLNRLIFLFEMQQTLNKNDASFEKDYLTSFWLENLHQAISCQRRKVGSDDFYKGSQACFQKYCKEVLNENNLVKIETNIKKLIYLIRTDFWLTDKIFTFLINYLFDYSKDKLSLTHKTEFLKFIQKDIRLSLHYINEVSLKNAFYKIKLYCNNANAFNDVRFSIVCYLFMDQFLHFVLDSMPHYFEQTLFVYWKYFEKLKNELPENEGPIFSTITQMLDFLAMLPKKFENKILIKNIYFAGIKSLVKENHILEKTKAALKAFENTATYKEIRSFLELNTLDLSNI